MVIPWMVILQHSRPFSASHFSLFLHLLGDLIVWASSHAWALTIYPNNMVSNRGISYSVFPIEWIEGFCLFYCFAIDFFISFNNSRPNSLIRFLQGKCDFISWRIFNRPFRIKFIDRLLKFTLQNDLICSLISDFEMGARDFNIKL